MSSRSKIGHWRRNRWYSGDRREAHHALDARAVVPTAVEQHDLARGGEVLDVALEVPLRALPLGGRGQGDDAADAGVEVLRHPLDRAALARGVASLEHDDETRAGRLDPLLHLDELGLHPQQLGLVDRLRHLAGLAASVLLRGAAPLVLLLPMRPPRSASPIIGPDGRRRLLPGESRAAQRVGHGAVRRCGRNGPRRGGRGWRAGRRRVPRPAGRLCGPAPGRSRRGPRSGLAAFASSSSRRVSEIRLRASSTSNTLTRTTSPDFTTSRGSDTKVADIAETCTSPSWCTPTSTNAPNAATFVTWPSRTMPGRRSESLWTPSANVAVRNAGRGSRPGFSSSARMSVTVGSPKRSSTNSLGGNDFSFGALPMSDPMSVLARARMRRTTGYASGCTPETSSGSSPPRMRRKPAHCSNALGPRRGTSASAVRVRNGPLAVAVGDDLRGEGLGDARHPPQQRRRRGVDVDADGVHAVLHHGVERAGQRGLGQVVLVLPDPDRLGVDLDELRERVLQAPGDGDRAAQRDVHPGQLGRRVGRRRVHRAPASLTTTGTSPSAGLRAASSRASFSVSREAVPLPIATSSTSCARASFVNVASAASQARRGSCG